MILNKNRRFFKLTQQFQRRMKNTKKHISNRREEKLKGRKEEMRVEVNRGKERLWADTVGNRSDRSIDQSIWGLLKSTTMSVFTYSRTSICQDVAGLVNKVAVFVVLDGGRSWALHMGRRNRYQRRMPREDPISGVECTVWWPGSHWSTIGPRVFVFMMDEQEKHRQRTISPPWCWRFTSGPRDVVVVVRMLIGWIVVDGPPRSCVEGRVVVVIPSVEVEGPHPRAVASTDRHTHRHPPPPPRWRRPV